MLLPILKEMRTFKHFETIGNSSRAALFSSFSFLLPLCFSCAGAPPKTAPEPDPTQAEIRTLRSLNESLKGRIDTLEARIASLTDKLDATQISVGNLLHSTAGARPAVATPVKPTETTSKSASLIPAATQAASDPEKGFSTDIALSTYRQGRIHFEARQYPEAILEFSRFLQRHADHVLAGSAQFFLGESYKAKKEPQLAMQEYQRVLTSYDRSPHVPEALLSLLQLEESLAMTQAASRHRQQLLSLYPQSPAARVLLAQKTSPEPVSVAPEKALIPTAPGDPASGTVEPPSKGAHP
jgi:TolA-binding protein